MIKRRWSPNFYSCHLASQGVAVLSDMNLINKLSSKKKIIEQARQWPNYFSRFFPISVGTSSCKRSLFDILFSDAEVSFRRSTNVGNFSFRSSFNQTKTNEDKQWYVTSSRIIFFRSYSTDFTHSKWFIDGYTSDKETDHYSFTSGEISHGHISKEDFNSRFKKSNI